MPDAHPQILLASSSPRRGELLEQINIRFDTVVADIDETPLADEPAQDYVRRLALAKAGAGRARNSGNLPVLGADTAVVVDGEIFGKPRDREHALAMLARLSGRMHRVLTGVALVAHKAEQTRLSESRVTFREISTAEMEAYWATGEPRGKAGAYAIQGRAAVFVERLEGSYSGVMGLPLFETADLLSAFNIALFKPPG